jgi:hypothetical protein
MSATSINIQPVKGGSEIHNFREKDLSYVRSELSHLNESWTIDSISNRLSDIKERYQNNTGQRMQKKATPIREGVIVIEPGTSMDQLRDFATRCEERFGIKTFQIHMHKDEGHITRISKMSLSSLSVTSKLHLTLSHPHFRGLCSNEKLLLG